MALGERHSGGRGLTSALSSGTLARTREPAPLELGPMVLPAAAVEAIAARAAELVLEQLGSALSSPYLTVPETAQYMRCSRQRIDDLLSQGRLTRHKDGARTLVERAEVDAYLSCSGTADGVAPALPRPPRDGL
jgi:excisionase family DNA binding protein